MAIEKAFLLRHHYLFRTLDPTVLRRIVDLGITTRLERGDVLFRKGDEGNALYGVLQGQIRISASSPTGREVIMNLMEEGEVFGEIALLDGGTRTADAIAIARAELLTIRRRDFLNFLEREPNLAVHLIKLLCERVRWTSGLFEDSAFLTLPGRLAKRLLALADLRGTETDAGVEVDLQLSQSELGFMMGTSRESVNRHLQTWRRDGWIDLRRGVVTIRDRDALERAIGAEYQM